MKGHRRHKQPRQQQRAYRPQQPDQPQKGAVLPAQGGIVRGMKQMQKADGHRQHLGRAIQNQHNLPLQEKGGRPVGALGEAALGQKGIGPVLQQLLQRANGQHMIHPQPCQAVFHPAQTFLVHGVFQVHHAQVGGNRVPQGRHFANQLRGVENASKQGDVVPQGFVEALMGAVDHAFGQRGGHAAAHKGADVEAQRAGHAVHQQHRLTVHQAFDGLRIAFRLFHLAQGNHAQKRGQGCVGGGIVGVALAGGQQVVLQKIAGGHPVHKVNRRLPSVHPEQAAVHIGIHLAVQPLFHDCKAALQR